MKKGIILAGGKGTRLSPLTRVTSKQLLPVYDKPMICYPLSVLMYAGIQDILIVSSPLDLPRFRNLFEDGSHLGIRISYSVQHEPLGIAHALLVAEEFIQNEPVALILGDNIFYGAELFTFLQMAKKDPTGVTIFGYPVKDPTRYGVIQFDDDGRVGRIIEKPEFPPSKYAVTGLYFYDGNVTRLAKKLRPSARGEYEITDLNNLYLERGELKLVMFSEGFVWLDSGNFEELHKASQYVKLVQEMHNTKIAAIEKIAYEMGFITLDRFIEIAKSHEASDYGKYLLEYAAKEESFS